jgi:group I intron endonuclease
MVGEVYLIENKINNHKYIGQTTQGYLNRFQQHLRETQYGDSSALHNAIRKWGEDNFKVELIETCDLDQLDEREIYWISFYNTFKSKEHYNMTSGGEGHLLSDEIKDKISDTMKKIPRGEKWEKSMSDAMKKKMANGEKWGFMLREKYDTSSHHKRKIKGTPDLNPSGNALQWGYKPLSDEVLIFDSITEAANKVKGIGHSISRAAKGGWTAYGYKWELLDKRPKSMKVYAVDPETGDRTETFPSIKAAARAFGNKNRDSEIRKSLRKPGIQKGIRKYWYYAEEDG